jgi:hypothetical protein
VVSLSNHERNISPSEKILCPESIQVSAFRTFLFLWRKAGAAPVVKYLLLWSRNMLILLYAAFAITYVSELALKLRILDIELCRKTGGYQQLWQT